MNALGLNFGSDWKTDFTARIAKEVASAHPAFDKSGAVLGIDSFGESAPAGVLMKHFGFTVENVVAKAKTLV